jgi:hypothetical protein
MDHFVFHLGKLVVVKLWLNSRATMRPSTLRWNSWPTVATMLFLRWPIALFPKPVAVVGCLNVRFLSKDLIIRPSENS